MINILSPLFNGFSHTGTLGRTALNIRAKGRSPLSGIAKFIFKLVLAIFLAKYLEKIPMPCISGILLYVAKGMIKKREINEILNMNNYHIALMCYTVIAVPAFGFMIGIITAIIIYTIFCRQYETKKRKTSASRSRKMGIIKKLNDPNKYY